MSPEAVLLAWGSPANKSEGFRNGRDTERWEYAGTRPVYTTHFGGGYGRGFYGPYRYSGVGMGLGPDVTYVPYRRASVWFVNGRVDEWERLR